MNRYFVTLLFLTLLLVNSSSRKLMHTEPVQEVCEPGFYESVVEKYMRFVLD